MLEFNSEFLKVLSAVFACGVVSAWAAGLPPGTGSCTHIERTSDLAIVGGEIGRCGGTLVIGKRSEPRTLNPLIAADSSSRDLISLLTADLIHINRYTQHTEPALAKSWSVSHDGLAYTLHLRSGIQFSDGHRFDADDVIFTFQSYLDPRSHAPQRDLLLIDGKPISVRKIDTHTVLFTLAKPYAAAERIFDSIAILPRHLLQSAFEAGQLATAWNLNTDSARVAGLGPFRFKSYTPGQKIVIERNPYYWKIDAKQQRLPYLDELVSLVIPNSNAEVLRFQSGETDIIDRLSAADYALLERYERGRNFRLYDLGPGLEYNFFFFNLNVLQTDVLPSFRSKQQWFRSTAFRQAVSAAIDRSSIIRLAYRGRAYPLSTQVTPGNKTWLNLKLPQPVYSPERARRPLQDGGFSWNAEGSLLDAQGRAVSFSILVNAASVQQVQMATLIQADLKKVGMEVTQTRLDRHSFLTRIFDNFKYEPAILALADGDSDPNTEMNVLTSTGNDHVWSLKSSGSEPPWQKYIDSLMQAQLITSSFRKRKQLFDQVQELLWVNMPAVFLVSPNILVGAKNDVGNFKPAILSSYTLWNTEQLFLRQQPH